MSNPNPFAYQGPMIPTGGSMFAGTSNWGLPQNGAGVAPEMSEFQSQQLAQGQQMIDLQTPSGWQKGAQTFGNVAQGLAGLGNMYLGFQGMKQQKKAFEFNKGVTNTNLGNSIMDYNRRLNDTLSNRALNNGQGEGWVSSQLEKYSAKRSG